MAHELKNPLTSLASAVEMFSRAKDDATRARLLEIVRGDVKRIDRLITDISDASRLDAELSREAKEPVALSKFLATLIEIYRMTETSPKVEFVLRDELPPGTSVRGRDERFGQVFRNLIDNATRHARGRVTISGASEGGMVALTVFDDGPGIPQSKREEALRRGERLDASGPGSGVGLAIVADIAEACGATLSFDEIDEGFGVTLRIPRGCPAKAR